MDRPETAIASGIFALVGGIFKLFTYSKDGEIKYIESTKKLDAATPNDCTIRPVHLSTILETENPVTLKLENINWIHVINKKYNVRATRHLTKQDVSVLNNKLSLLDTYSSKEYEHVKTETHSAPIKEVNGININNLIPRIANQYSTSTAVFQHCDTSKEEFGIFENLFGTSITSTPDSVTISSKPKLIGTEFRRTGILDNKQQYLIVGDFNGREFVINDNLTIERNTNIDTLINDKRSTRNALNFLSNSSFLIGGVLFAAYIIPSRL
jgi:hypothetical protein